MTQQEILSRMSEIEDRIRQEYLDKEMELQTQILSLKLEVESLKKENDVIWKRAIDMVTEEKMKVRDLETRWGKLLEDAKC